MKIRRNLNSEKVVTDWEKEIKYFLNDDGKEIFFLPENYKYVQ